MKKKITSVGLGVVATGLMVMGGVTKASAETHAIGAAISDDSFALLYENVIYQSEQGQFVFNPSLLFAEHSTNVIAPGILWRIAPRDLIATHLELGLKAFFIDGDRASANALAAGIGAKFALPTAPEFSLGADFYYSPRSTTYKNGADHVVNWNVRFGYNFNPSTEVYLGYRDLKVEFSEQRSQNIDRGLFLGFTFRF